MYRGRQTCVVGESEDTCEVAVKNHGVGLSMVSNSGCIAFFFFFNDTATTEIYTLSLHDALPISTHF